MKVVLVGKTAIISGIGMSIFRVRVVFLDNSGKLISDGYIGRVENAIIEVPDGARYMGVIRSPSRNERIIAAFDIMRGEMVKEVRSTKHRQVDDLKRLVVSGGI